ncbi:MAG: hypothetical protein KF841_14265 [Phycisphaerae bacterium]|nr:hypothetical protein [Phycisphaerae bacterium]
MLAGTGCAGEQATITDAVTSVTTMATKTTDTILAKIHDEGVLEQWATQMSGNLHDPSLVIESGPVWRTRIGFDGANARIDAEAAGDATRLPAGVRESILEAMKGMDSSDPRYQQLLNLIAQDRKEKTGGEQNKTQ